MKFTHRSALTAVIPVVTALLLSACSPVAVKEEIKGEETPAPQTLTVKVSTETDPSLLDQVLENPYSELLDMAKDSLHPDEKLYNELYFAIREGKETLDVSGYDLSTEKKWASLDSMYSTVGLELFHVDRMKLSPDGRQIRITYVDDVEKFNELSKIYYARLSHLIYNVPEGPTQLEQYFSIYDHIAEISSYSDDMDNQLTHTASSIILHGKGICGGYSMLNHHVLKKIGIQSVYLMNEPHAWNMVTIEGVDYVTDLTWGAGNTGFDDDNLRHILTSTEERNRTLENSGFGGSTVYTGFYRDDMVIADEPENDEFNHLYDLYSSYALDAKNGHLYYSDAEGVHRTDLNGENRVTLSTQPGEELIYFDESLYYISFSDSFLYRLTPHDEPELVSDEYRLSKLDLHKGILSYKETGEEGKVRTLDLNRYKIERNEAKILDEITLRREDTLKFVLDFSSTMNTDGAFQEFIGLLDENDQLIPLNYIWSDDGKKLTLRSSEPFTEVRSLRLRIGMDLQSAHNEKLEESLELKIRIAD